MKPPIPSRNDNYDDPPLPDDLDDPTAEEDFWFLPGPPEDVAEHRPPGPVAEPPETSAIDEWAEAEAGHAAQLAHVAGRLGGLGERLRTGPTGWRHRLALIEAAELSWSTGDRVGADRLALWMALRVSGAEDDSAALARIGWAVRRLTGGARPEEGLAAFIDRRDAAGASGEAEPLEERADGWRSLILAASQLHPITRGAMGFHLWALAGLGQQGDRLEAAVTAARLSVPGGPGAIFAPIAMGGGEGLRASGPVRARLTRWLDGMESAILTATRHLDDIEVWSARAQAAMTGLSGRTPPVLCKAFTEWPLLSAPMAETLTGASRAAVQRNLAWMESRGLIREVTGQGRFRMWKATAP